MHFQNVTDAVYGEPELDPWIKPTVFGNHMVMLGDQGDILDGFYVHEIFNF